MLQMKAPTIVQMYGIQIRTLDRSSSISIGRTTSRGNHVVNHRNQGFGEQNADGVIQNHSVAIVEDSDFIDSDLMRR